MKTLAKTSLIVFALSLTAIFANHEAAAQVSYNYETLSKLSAVTNPDQIKKILFPLNQDERLIPIISHKPVMINDRVGWQLIPDKDEFKPFTVAHTTDGGRTWQKTLFSPEEGLPSNPVYACFPDAQHAFVLFGGEGVGSGEAFDFAYTADGGAHWNRTIVRVSGGATGMNFTNGKSGWISADTGAYYPNIHFYYTTDSGKTWNDQELPTSKFQDDNYGDSYPPVFRIPQSKEGILPVKLIKKDNKNNPNAKAIVQLVFYRTHDGGKTWLPPK